jgi:HSP20 family protein
MRLVRYTYPNSRNLAPFPGLPSPWSGLDTEIDRLFESVLGDYSTPAADRFPVDLYEDKESYFVRAELPGVERNDINVEMIEDYLTIAAARKSNQNGQEESFSFSRSVSIPESVQSDKVVAQYQDGVLTVTLPKKEEAKPRKIAVSVS